MCLYLQTNPDTRQRMHGTCSICFQRFLHPFQRDCFDYSVDGFTFRQLEQHCVMAFDHFHRQRTLHYLKVQKPKYIHTNIEEWEGGRGGVRCARNNLSRWSILEKHQKGETVWKYIENIYAYVLTCHSSKCTCFLCAANLAKKSAVFTAATGGKVVAGDVITELHSSKAVRHCSTNSWKKNKS